MINRDDMFEFALIKGSGVSQRFPILVTKARQHLGRLATIP